MNKELKAYMAYSRINGSAEGAFLVFDYSAREAKKTAWNASICSYICPDGWMELAVNKIEMNETLKSQMLKNEPHVIDNPICCKECNLWGLTLDKNGICEGCREIRELSTEI